jgi:competence protein ComEA
VVTALGPRGSSQLVIPPGPAEVSSAPSAAPSGEEATAPSATSTDPAGSTDARPALFVHIIGAVVAPGLYQLHEGDRAVDAVAAAGGLAADADQAQVNLARFLSDGEQIIVPRVGDVPAPAVAGAAPGGAGGLININTADAAALEELPGVGPALAERIVLWREANGSFASVDDLLNVTGIGQKKLDGLRDSAAL